MAVYTEKKTYHTKAHMGMIDVTEDFQARSGGGMPAAQHLCRDGHRLHHRRRGGPDDPGVRAGHCEPRPEGGAGCVLPYLDEKGRVVPYWHHGTWHDDNGSSTSRQALLSPSSRCLFVNGKITVGPWQNLTLIECDTRDRVRDLYVPSDGRVSAAWVPSVRHSSVPAGRDLGGRALPARTSEMQGPRPRQAAGGCDTQDRMRDIVFQVMGEQAARRLQKDHSMTKETRPGMGAFFYILLSKSAENRLQFVQSCGILLLLPFKGMPQESFK